MSEYLTQIQDLLILRYQSFNYDYLLYTTPPLSSPISETPTEPSDLPFTPFDDIWMLNYVDNAPHSIPPAASDASTDASSARPIV